MEQIQNEMRENQGSKLSMAKMRALERQSKMPQNEMNTELEPTTRSRGGGQAGLARVIGAGKKSKKREESPCSVDSGDGGASHMGQMMREHLTKLHGCGYANKFFTGTSKGGGAPRGLPPSGRQVSHARMSPAVQPGVALGGQNVPPQGIAPMAYGSAPQAPASFQRNSVSLGSQGMLPLPSAQTGNGKMSLKLTEVRSPKPPMVKGGAVLLNKQGVYPGVGVGGAEPKINNRSARGLAVSKCMKGMGLTLGQASKYVKEHPDEF